jgi:hypothetical protein
MGKNSKTDTPIPHLPPSDCPAGYNIDRQYAALVNMAEPIRTTRGLQAKCFCGGRVARRQHGLKSREFSIAGG